MKLWPFRSPATPSTCCGGRCDAGQCDAGRCGSFIDMGERTAEGGTTIAKSGGLIDTGDDVGVQINVYDGSTVHVSVIKPSDS